MRAERKVNEQICKESVAIRKSGSIWATVAGEGWLGGYRAALNDVLLILGDIEPSGDHLGGDSWMQELKKTKSDRK